MTIHPQVEEAFQEIDAMIFSGGPDRESRERLLYFLSRWNKAVLIEVESDEIISEDDTTMIGNECTGDVSAVVKYLDSFGIKNDNWIGGVKGKFKISAKVFAEDSDFGIQNGRISKIQICDVSQEHWGFESCYLNYDRGWDIRPNDPEVVEFMNGLLTALGNDELGDEDLIWYDLYGYYTKEEFENCEGRVHLMSLGSKNDAMEEARGYIDDDDTYEVIKVISNDSEEIEIIKR